MAQISLDGFDEIDRMFKELGEIPFSGVGDHLELLFCLPEATSWTR